MPIPRLSICIPTYNFGRFIGKTLESVVRQAAEDVEIVVLDGGSTDDTAVVVERYRRAFPRLLYHRQDFKGGIDRDMAKTIELASGEYCWLLSADDVLVEDALERIVRKIRSRMDLYLCSFTRCTIDMKPVAKHPILDCDTEAVFNLGDPVDRTQYFSSALTTTAFFSYMSSIVVRRDRWESAGADDSFTGSCWGHVARIFRMLPDGLKVVFLPDDYLLNRGENDSFLDAGRVNRIGIAVDGYHRLGEAYFKRESAEAFHMRRVLKNEYSVEYLLYTKLLAEEGGDQGNRKRLDALVNKLYVDRSLFDRLRHFIYEMSPSPLLRFAASARWRIRGAKLRRDPG